MEIQTNRLILRPYQKNDVEFLTSLLSNQEVVRYIGDGSIKDKEEIENFYSWIQRTYQQNSDYGLKVICLKETGERVGHAGLVPQRIEGEGELEVGYWIAREHWGKGYATEIAKELVKYGLYDLGERRLIALIQPDNRGSLNVAKKIGMYLDKQIKLKGQNVNVYATED
ncbi:GNAT family N-acetyltransferase [Tenuibacillus multivorans]|uniref:Protein N-acetyltransferase, RimJ/RimL family n=1 Tax=Tenuibacillus multivorans TaxID=237069 RepID=A0A1G9WFE6_9BACI|nr:GNAT family N-acetyltransferase [Tenuibacillus multivorans]GEL76442.1 acetyltransferase [Tenuibacillus multivorans]SDM83274.1 Protein N-acetyltransferase, RimJ/RimL family [Tenuibacillus multivorans]